MLAVLKVSAIQGISLTAWVAVLDRGGKIRVLLPGRREQQACESVIYRGGAA